MVLRLEAQHYRCDAWSVLTPELIATSAVAGGAELVAPASSLNIGLPALDETECM